MNGRCLALLLTLSIAQAVWGADWISGQAARAVVGQTSFSAHEPGFDPVALTLANGRLYIADSSRRVFAYQVETILSGKSSGRCAVCFVTPLSITPQAVSQSSARFASYRNSIAVADPENARILFWRDASQPGASNGPDVVLSGAANFTAATSVALDGEHLYVGDPATHKVLIWNKSTLRPDAPPNATLGTYDAGAGMISSPIALASDGANLFVADASNHRILVFTPGEASLAPELVLSTASQMPTPLAPGGLISIHGSHFAETQETAIDDGSTAMPTALAGVELVVDGHPIPLLAIGPSEIRAQVPYDITYTSNASVALRWNDGPRAGRNSAAIALAVRAVAPGVFAFPGSAEPRKGVLLHALAQAPITAEDPAIQGENLIIWASGLGAVDASDTTQAIAAGKPFEGIAAQVHADVQALLNGEPVEVLSAVLPHGAVGIYEVRLAVPPNTSPSAAVTLSLRESAVLSNTVSFPLGRATAGSTIHN